MTKIVDLTGQKFGKLLVVKELEERKNKQKQYKCLCDCGNTSVVFGSNLKRGNTKSCGCIKVGATRVSLLGQKFSRLLVLNEKERNKHGHITWECLCDCGSITIVASSALTSGGTRSCGCYNMERRIETNTTHGQSKTKQNKAFRENKRRAAKLQRTPSWLTEEDWEEIRWVYFMCPRGFQVDHKIPLQGKNVSGFHTPENLQYLPSSLNHSKLNTFKPIFQVSVSIN